MTYSIRVNNTDSVYGLPTGTGIAGVNGVILPVSLLDYQGVFGGLGHDNFQLIGSVQSTQTSDERGSNATNATINQSDFFVVQAEVDYQYAPRVISTPEPSTIALAGSALLGLVLLRRRLAMHAPDTNFTGDGDLS
jgi:hypothetical protein